MADRQIPFSMQFVIQTTLRHMHKDIDLSIEKTLARIPEFEGDSVKSKEIFSTLAQLSVLREILNQHTIQSENT